MSEKIQKHITVKQTCTDCQNMFYNKNSMISVPIDFKVSDIKIQLKAPSSYCPDCDKKVDPKFSFYHEEKL